MLRRPAASFSDCIWWKLLPLTSLETSKVSQQCFSQKVNKRFQFFPCVLVMQLALKWLREIHTSDCNNDGEVTEKRHRSFLISLQLFWFVCDPLQNAVSFYRCLAPRWKYMNCKNCCFLFCFSFSIQRSDSGLLTASRPWLTHQSSALEAPRPMPRIIQAKNHVRLLIIINLPYSVKFQHSGIILMFR